MIGFKIIASLVCIISLLFSLGLATVGVRDCHIPKLLCGIGIMAVVTVIFFKIIV